ncbi:DUF6515 family protein [Haliea sp. E17]|uniref:DUF6515 family protein n=1 Tax=Haliea sp. E17 TaxID=3401576 RepID=UPI003AB001F1
MTAALLLYTPYNQADPGGASPGKNNNPGAVHNRPPPAQTRQKPPGDFYRYDDRFHHNRYYPRPGYVAPYIPGHYQRIVYHDVPYFYLSGIWYRSAGAQFQVIAPPIGIFVPILPPYYTTIWLGGATYYYANDVYYVWRPQSNGYQVVQAPAGAESQQLPTVSDELFVYPKKGQSEEQITEDRYQCHVWSRNQTQYDPTQPPTNLSAAEASQKRDDYQRAMRACLEGKDYSVR